MKLKTFIGILTHINKIYKNYDVILSSDEEGNSFYSIWTDSLGIDQSTKTVMIYPYEYLYDRDEQFDKSINSTF